MPADRQVAGVILAGGRSRRFGGTDKALEPLAGRPLVSHAADRLAPQVQALALSANGDAGRFAFLGLPTVADSISGREGPLAGILAGLDWAARAAPQCSHLLSAPCDCPFLPSDLAAQLWRAAARAPSRAAYAASAGRDHFVVGLWPVAVRQQLAQALDAGVRRAGEWAAAAGAVRVVFPAAAADPFANINTPAQLAQAERQIGRENAAGHDIGQYLPEGRRLGWCPMAPPYGAFLGGEAE